MNPAHGFPAARAPLDRTVRTARGLLAVLVCLAGILLVGGLGTGRAAAATDHGALLRVAHLSPDTPAVDVALAPLPADGAPLDDPGPDIATGLRYGDVGPYRDLTPGSYALSVRRAGSSAQTPPALSLRLDLAPGSARTVAFSGSFADLSPVVLTDDLSAPPAGAARVRVLAAASGAPSLDLAVTGGPVLAERLPFGAAGSWLPVPAGRSTARLDGGSGTAVELPLELRAGSVSSLVVLDAPDGGVILRVVVDAAGPAAVPTGAVAAGGGGTAGTSSRLPVALAGAGGLLLAGLRGRRRAVLPLVTLLGALSVPAHAAAPAGRPTALPVVVAAVARPAAGPVRLQVPTAGIDAALAGIGLDGAGTLRPADDLRTAGWFREGPAPGEPGPAVLAGHVDSSEGPAVFFRLGDVAAGDPVVVTRADGSSVRFTVTRVARYAKATFPTTEVYGPTPDAELRLITCGGDFDRAAGSYRDNVVVYGVLQGRSSG